MSANKREISPAVNASVEQYIGIVPAEIKVAIEAIRRGKMAGERLRPSTALIGESSLLTRKHRGALLDAVAALVDENLCGRSDMCCSLRIFLTWPSTI